MTDGVIGSCSRAPAAGAGFNAWPPLGAPAASQVAMHANCVHVLHLCRNPTAALHIDCPVLCAYNLRRAICPPCRTSGRRCHWRSCSSWH